LIPLFESTLCSNLRAETSIALAEMAGSSSGGGSKAANQRDALEEARLAGGGFIKWPYFASMSLST